jgi:hypothetical protein
MSYARCELLFLKPSWAVVSPKHTYKYNHPV